jgi:hypothetical protein
VGGKLTGLCLIGVRLSCWTGVRAYLYIPVSKPIARHFYYALPGSLGQSPRNQMETYEVTAAENAA